jgi:putative redox protein
MVSRIFEFESPRGYRLSGVLETPVATVRGWAIFAHCLTCGKESPAAARIARGLALAGVGVLRFDFAGVGASGGDFAASTFAADADDLVAAGQAMAAAGMQPDLLVGHSLGGSAVLAAAESMPAVRAVATLAAPADVAHVLHHFDPDSLTRIKSDGEAEVRLGERYFVVRQSFVDDLSRHDLVEAVGRLRRALLILHAPTDTTVGIENASRLFLAAKHPKSFISLDTADHLLARASDAEFAAATIAAWASRYLPDRRAEVMEPEPAAGAIAEETGEGLFQTNIRFRGASLIADEPVEVGGLGSGPGPFDLVCAGLAACTTMTLRLYANRKGIPLERAHATVSHSRTMETPADRFRRSLVLEGPLSDDDRERLLAIAERCPVDLTLARGSDVTVELAEPE